MLDFGASNDNGNRDRFGDLNSLDAPTVYTAAFFSTFPSTAGSLMDVFSKFNNATSGWLIYILPGSTLKLRVLHGDGTNTEVSSNTNIDSSLRSWFCVWTGSALNFYRDGVADGTPAFTRAITANTTAVSIGSRPSVTDGASGKRGHVMWWNTNLTSGDAATYHGGGSIPARSNLLFWHKGHASPGIDEITGTAGTVDGTVNITATDPPDSYFQDPGGFGLFAGCWAPALLGAAGLFGGYLRSHLRSSSLPRLWREMQRVFNCRIIGATEEEVVSVFDMLRQRTYVFVGA